MTFNVFKASRHPDDERIGEGKVMKIGSNDTVAGRTDEGTTIFEPP